MARTTQRCEEAERNEFMLPDEFARIANTLSNNISTLEVQLGRVKEALADVERMRTMLTKHQLLNRKLQASTASLQFNVHLCGNGMAGRLKVRHDEERLEIAVLHNGETLSRKSDMMSLDELSSGERSYTIFALLLALGEDIREYPLRVVDSFDVGMDSVNRDKAIQLLVDQAKWDTTQQSIIVTSSDVTNGSLYRDPKVRILKLHHPLFRTRGQED